MLTKNRYSTKEMLRWTPKETIGYVPLMILITALIDFFDITFLHVPWTPVAIILAAIGFIIRFQKPCNICKDVINMSTIYFIIRFY